MMANEPHDTSALPAQGVTYTFPQSFAQQRLWIVDQLTRDSAAYNLPRAYRLVGPLSFDALEKALQGLVDRHESLRTTFTSESGSLLQEKEHSLNKMGHAMHDLDPVFKEFSRTPKLAALVESLGYADPGLLQSMYIFKPPRIGGEVTCHQDSTFLYTEPDSCIGFWFALEDATLENGCMHFIPGVHKAPLKQRNLRQDNGQFVIEILDDTPWPENATAPAEAAVGTLVIFKGRAPHMSGPNLSEKSRHAYTLHIIDKASHYPANNWLQRGPDMPLKGFELN